MITFVYCYMYATTALHYHWSKVLEMILDLLVNCCVLFFVFRMDLKKSCSMEAPIASFILLSNDSRLCIAPMREIVQFP
jgi:prolipoprotein diacylglyceryltransferase